MPVELNCHLTLLHMIDSIKEEGHWILAFVRDLSLSKMAPWKWAEKDESSCWTKKSHGLGFSGLTNWQYSISYEKYWLVLEVWAHSKLPFSFYREIMLSAELNLWWQNSEFQLRGKGILELKRKHSQTHFMKPVLHLSQNQAKTPPKRRTIGQSP
jgi:hypothetical protein